MPTTKNQNWRKRMDGANSIENKRPCKCDELITNIVYAQRFESLTVVLCNWHMPIVNENDSDSEERKKKEVTQRARKNQVLP